MLAAAGAERNFDPTSGFTRAGKPRNPFGRWPNGPAALAHKAAEAAKAKAVAEAAARTASATTRRGVSRDMSRDRGGGRGGKGGRGGVSTTHSKDGSAVAHVIFSIAGELVVGVADVTVQIAASPTVRSRKCRLLLYPALVGTAAIFADPCCVMLLYAVHNWPVLTSGMLAAVWSPPLCFAPY